MKLWTRAFIVGLLGLVACDMNGSTSPPSSPVEPLPSDPSPSAALPFSDLAPCSDQPGAGLPVWRCGVIHVPLDRSDPAGKQISIAYFVLPHTDLTTPAAEPMFSTPGGPGGDGFDNYGLYALQDSLLAHHDFVSFDPRGTGSSGAIDCPDLQDGWDSLEAFHAAVTSCARQLGPAADRYGSGDVAMDLDDLRQALGFDQIDYYAPSYGSVVAQAYAVRFPHRLHALVLDAGLTVTDPQHVYDWGQAYPRALVRVESLLCARQPACAAGKSDMGDTLAWLADRLGREPIQGRAAGSEGGATHVLVDQAELANIIAYGGTDGGAIDPSELIRAAAALRRGDTHPLLGLGASVPFWPTDQGKVAQWSQGDNLAASCNDQDFVWKRSDPIHVRKAKVAAAAAAFQAGTFAPFSVADWVSRGFGGFINACLTWPVPGRFVPAIPAHRVFPDVPTLILSGDVDTWVPTEITRKLLDEFPNATFVTVAGAAHPTMGFRGDCVPVIVARFFETLNAGDTSCAEELI
jgi:pimeloyl-ACP methyl ester carboxylesterase